MFALLLGLIIGGEKFFKNRHAITLAATDASMSEAEFPSGSYKLDVRILDISNIKPGDVVAFRVPGETTVEKMARVAAVEGQRISCEPKVGLRVDDSSPSYITDVTRRIPEMRVPRGCVYVMCDNPLNGTDSVNFGPLPIQQIIGKVKR